MTYEAQAPIISSSRVESFALNATAYVFDYDAYAPWSPEVENFFDCLAKGDLLCGKGS